jgi:hypothetical protein
VSGVVGHGGREDGHPGWIEGSDFKVRRHHERQAIEPPPIIHTERQSMLKKITSMIAAIGMLCMLSGTATAGFFAPEQSTLSFTLGALPPITLAGTYSHNGTATLTNNGSLHDLSDTASIWKGAGVAVGTSLLTGVALITKLTLTVTNNSGSFTASYSASNPWGGALSTGSTPNSNTLCPSGCLGGLESMNGQFIVSIIGLPLPFPLTVVGVGGVASLPVGQAAILATGGPFISGKARLTNITTNVVSMPGRGGVTGIGITLNPNGTEEIRTFTTGGGFVTQHPGATNLSTRATITLSGSTSLASASAGGMVTMISPLRIDTGALMVGVIPGKATKKFVFVPEPGTVLLLVSGAAGLIFVGRKRMKG